MNLREAFLASKLFGNGGGGGSGDAGMWDAIAQGNPPSSYVAVGSTSYIVSSAFTRMPLTGASFANASTVGSQAFQNCGRLSWAYLPKLQTLGASAFTTCDLRSIDFPNLTFVDTATFNFNYNLSDVKLSSASSIGPNAFQACSSLINVSIPEAEMLYQSAFHGALSLSYIYAPKVSVVGVSAFNSCTGLAAASFPALTSISSAAFNGCKSLMSLYLLGSTVVTLYNSAVFGTTCPIRSSVGGVYGSVFVPASLLGAYQAKSVWSSYYSARLVGLTDEEIAALNA